MLTNALQRRATPEFDANATPRCGVLLSIEGHPAFVARGKNKPSLPSPHPRSRLGPRPRATCWRFLPRATPSAEWRAGTA